MISRALSGLGVLVLRSFVFERLHSFWVVVEVGLGCCGGYVGLRSFRHRGLLRSTCALPSRLAITRLICGTALTPYTSDTLTAIDHSPSRYTSVATLLRSFPNPHSRGFGIWIIPKPPPRLNRGGSLGDSSSISLHLSPLLAF